MTRDVDSTHKLNKSVVENYSSPSSVGVRFLAKKERALPDVGVLQRRRQRSKNNKPPLFKKKHHRTRFLEDGVAAPAEVATCLKPDTCEPKLCECVANGGDANECAHELHAVCQGVTSTSRNVDGTAETWTIDGCVDEQNLEYYTNIYCLFSGCIATGGTYTQCSCDHFYKPYCETYGTIFPESETVQLHCEKANCCSAAEDDTGREICLLDDMSAHKSSEDSSEPVPLGASPGPLTIPNSADPSYVPNQQGLGVSAAQIPNGSAITATPFQSFGLSLISAFAIIVFAMYE